jgi:hypothetical protein
VHPEYTGGVGALLGPPYPKAPLPVLMGKWEFSPRSQGQAPRQAVRRQGRCYPRPAAVDRDKGAPWLHNLKKKAVWTRERPTRTRFVRDIEEKSELS